MKAEVGPEGDNERQVAGIWWEKALQPAHRLKILKRLEPQRPDCDAPSWNALPTVAQDAIMAYRLQAKNHHIIAFQGEIEILDATWSLRDGRQVSFRLCGEPYGRIHPFKKYQQRRGGKVGSRFRAAFARTTTGEAINSFELMLCSWKDSSTAGQQVTFWIDDEPDAHPFCGCAYRANGTPGEIFALVLVELDDEDKAIDQVKRDKVAAAGAGRSFPSDIPDAAQAGGAHSQDQRATTASESGNEPGSPPPARPAARGKQSQPRKLSSSAHLLVSGALFLRYLQETKATLVKDWTSDKARIYAKQVMKVESLSDLDRDAAAAERFHNLIRKAFDRWYRQEP